MAKDTNLFPFSEIKLILNRNDAIDLSLLLHENSLDKKLGNFDREIAYKVKHMILEEIRRVEAIHMAKSNTVTVSPYDLAGMKKATKSKRS